MPRRFTTDNTFRSCSRCGKELTDPASRECGVGPVCRGKDNHLYAKTITANVPGASALILGTHADEFPAELQDRWLTVREHFVSVMSELEYASEQPGEFNATGADFRETVRHLDYCLSYRLHYELRNKVIEIVRYLGYVGLAGVLSGESSKSKAQVWFEKGRIFLSGTGCTPGFHKMRKIPGIKTPRYRGDKNPYSAPASQAGTFLSIVREHWPLYEGSIELLEDEASDWLKANPTVAATPSQNPDAVAAIQLRSEDFVLSFKWLKGADVKGMINKLKTIPSKERAYNPSTKNWMFRKQHLDQVKAIVEGTYEAVVVTNSDDETPAHEWKKRNPYPKRRRSRRAYYGGGYRW